MTGDELGWLEGISALHTRMDKVLQPVSDLAERACAEYENAAKCFAAAKDCGFDALSKGSDLFAQAEAQGFEIKAAAR
jgi:hypothetical protein